MQTVSSQLKQWDEVAVSYDLPAILIGNGGSMVVWHEFGYRSLYSKAVTGEIPHPLDEYCQAHFRDLDTTNFEHVLRLLKDMEAGMKRLPGFSAYLPAIKEIRRQYDMIRGALSESVKAAHVPFGLVSEAQLLAIRAELGKYKCIYSTNYDLLIYWAIMAATDGHFDDSFRGGGLPFDQAHVLSSSAATRVFYLHGGLHLYLTSSGHVVKRTATPGANLLDQFGTEYLEGAKPLIITEGKYQDKQAVINSTPYLQFGFNHLSTQSTQSTGLAVFGHSLTPECDQHIIDAINKRRPKVLAISIYPAGSFYEIEAHKSLLRKQFEGIRVVFFDSRSHPLGSDELRVERPQNNYATPSSVYAVARAQIRHAFGTDTPPWADLD